LVTAVFAGAALTAAFTDFLTGALARGAAFSVTFFSAGCFAVAAGLLGAASLAGTAAAAFAGTAGRVVFTVVTIVQFLENNEVYSLYR
jgi:hypothetical protein